jgi:SRSO17 transposase
MPVISTILNINAELYNYLNDVNYGMSKPQFNHLSSIINGLINIKGNKTISKIAEGIVSAKDKSSIYKFLSCSKWDDSLLNRNRINYINYFIRNNISDNSVGFLVIDDTVNVKKSAKKMQGLSFNHSHAEGKRVWSHCVVTSNFVFNDLSIPLQFQPYYSKDVCTKLNKPFKSKVDIAKDFINDFNAPDNCDSIYCLIDSWYTSTPLIESCLKKGFMSSVL